MPTPNSQLQPSPMQVHSASNDAQLAPHKHLSAPNPNSASKSIIHSRARALTSSAPPSDSKTEYANVLELLMAKSGESDAQHYTSPMMMASSTRFPEPAERHQRNSLPYGEHPRHSDYIPLERRSNSEGFDRIQQTVRRTAGDGLHSDVRFASPAATNYQSPVHPVTALYVHHQQHGMHHTPLQHNQYQLNNPAYPLSHPSIDSSSIGATSSPFETTRQMEGIARKQPQRYITTTAAPVSNYSTARNSLEPFAQSTASDYTILSPETSWSGDRGQRLEMKQELSSMVTDVALDEALKVLAEELLTDLN